MKLEEIEQAVFSKRPVLKEIISSFGKFPLADYVKTKWQLPGPKADSGFLTLLKEETELIYGEKIAGKVISLLSQKPLLSTIDHLGLLCHPIFINSDLIYSLHFKKDDYPLVLATESVSLNNTSSWSASFLWHEQGILKRVSFLPSRLKNLPVFSTPAIGANHIDQFNLSTNGRFEKLIKDLDFISHQQDFSYQASVVSHRVWQKIFPDAPKLVFLPLETAVSKYLVQILEDKENLISKIILTDFGRQAFKKYFSLENTFLFWAVDEKGKRKPIFDLPPEKKEILEFIRMRKLYASSPLCFLVLLSAGLSCVGGFTQTGWLTVIKDKFIKISTDLNLECGFESVPTKNFAESALAFIRSGDNFVMPTALDFFEAGQDHYKKYSKLSANLTLGQSFKLMLPTIYSVVVPKNEQVKGFNPSSMQQQIFESLNLGNLG